MNELLQVTDERSLTGSSSWVQGNLDSQSAQRMSAALTWAKVCSSPGLLWRALTQSQNREHVRRE